MRRWNWGDRLELVPLALALLLFVALMIVGVDPWWLPIVGIAVVLARYLWDQRPWLDDPLTPLHVVGRRRGLSPQYEGVCPRNMKGTDPACRERDRTLTVK